MSGDFDFDDSPPRRRTSHRGQGDFGRAVKWGAGVYVGIMLAVLTILLLGAGAMFFCCAGGTLMMGPAAVEQPEKTHKNR